MMSPLPPPTPSPPAPGAGGRPPRGGAPPPSRGCPAATPTPRPDLPGRPEPAEVVRLARDTIDEAELVPDPDQFLAGVPTEAGFAVDRLPAHREQLALPPGLRGLAAQTRFTPAEAFALESGLRSLVMG